MASESDVNGEVVAPEEAKSDKEFNFAAIRETLAETKQQLQQLQGENWQLKQQMSQASQPQQVQVDPLDELDDSDYLDTATFKRVFKEREEQFKTALQRQEEAFKLAQFKADNPDYDSVIQEYWPKLQNDAGLQQAIASSKDPRRLAYELGKAERVKQEKLAKAQAKAEKLQSNEPSLNTATGGGGATSLSAWDMSQEEFWKLVKSRQSGR